MTSAFSNAFERVGQSHKADDDFIDRLNHRFTVILLVTMASFVGMKQFVGEPISCWTPSQFSSAQVSYTNSICWLKGTYYLETNKSLIPQRTENKEFRVAYYQFVPYALLIMAFSFYLPHLLWRHITRRSGFDIRSLILDLKSLERGQANRKLDDIALEIHAALQSHFSDYHRNRCEIFIRILKIFGRSIRFDCFLMMIYIVVKILYIVNGCFQFYFLSHFLSFPFESFGYRWIISLNERFQSPSTFDSQWFPRVVMCEFMVRHLGSNQHWMVIQCNLPINLFNELIFFIIWCWLIVLVGLSVFSLIFFLVTSFNKNQRRTIEKLLYANSHQLNVDEEIDFFRNYLRTDGILVLRILSQNINDVSMSKLVDRLYQIKLKSR